MPDADLGKGKCLRWSRSVSGCRNGHGAIGEAEQQELEERSERALGELAVLQAKYQEASNPALHLVTLL